MKIIVSCLSVILIVTNCVLLLFQYDVFSSSVDEQSYQYEQEIELTFQKEKLIVEQHFYGLPQEEMVIHWPALSTSRSCHLEATDSCERLDEDLSSFKEGKSTQQSISYEISLDETWKSQNLVKDFTAKLKNGEVTYTTLHITDEGKRGGMWVTGLPALGNTSLELIDYTLAFGEGDVSEIYWQKEQLPVVYQNDAFTIYSQEKLAEGFTKMLDEIVFTNQAHISVLMGVQGKMDASSILFLENQDIATMQRELIVKNIALQYNISSDNLLLAEVVSSSLVGQPLGSAKSVWMVNELSSYFTKEQLNAWSTGLTKLKDVDGEKLDRHLSKVLNLQTSFFTANLQTKDNFPLLFEDARKVLVNEEQSDELHVLFKDGKILYKAYPLLEALGYSYRDTPDKGLYVENETRAFRFPVEEPFYVYNKKRFDAFSAPFEKIGAELYIEEAWMIRLFLLDIEKNEKDIYLTERISS